MLLFLRKTRFNQRGSTLLARNFDILEQGVHHLGNIYTGVSLCLHNSGLQSDYSVWLCGLWVQFRDRIWGRLSSKKLNQKIWYDREGIHCSWRFQQKLMFHFPAKFQRSVFSNSVRGCVNSANFTRSVLFNILRIRYKQLSVCINKLYFATIYDFEPFLNVKSLRGYFGYSFNMAAIRINMSN